MRTKEICNGEYVVYEDGRVWSNGLDRFLLEHGMARNGRYRAVVLRINNKQRQAYVHRLIAECFIPNPENKPEVNHIDGNGLNNSVNNLEWVTRSENMRHAFKTGLMDNVLKTKKCKCGELMAQRSEMCTKCRLDIEREKRREEFISERNKDADMLSRFCRSTTDKRFLSLWRSGMTLMEIGDIMGVSRQCIEQKHVILTKRLDKYNECLAIINGESKIKKGTL